jgi:archaemetzincin
MNYLYVGATPEFDDPEAFAAIASRLADALKNPVRQIALPAVDFTFDPERNQYRSIEVLNMLALHCPPDAGKLIALTTRDLFIPVLTFVYGHAQLGGRVAVASLARLRQEFYGLPPNREILIERFAKAALHEAGHTFGLVHCVNRACVMALATNIGQVDGKHAAFCPSCAARL